MKKAYKVGKKVVGTMKDGKFVKPVIFQKHHLHSYKAWAIDIMILNELIKDACKEIIIVDKESGRTWSLPFAIFIEKGFKINHGFGEQIACADFNWTEKIPGQIEMF